MLLDVGGSRFWFGVIPSGVFVFLAIDDNMIIVRGAFPRAGAGVIAGLKKVTVNRFGREVMVVFDKFGVGAFRDSSVVPSCFCHVFTMAQLIERTPGGLCQEYGIVSVSAEQTARARERNWSCWRLSCRSLAGARRKHRGAS